MHLILDITGCRNAVKYTIRWICGFKANLLKMFSYRYLFYKNTNSALSLNTTLTKKYPVMSTIQNLHIYCGFTAEKHIVYLLQTGHENVLTIFSSMGFVFWQMLVMRSYKLPGLGLINLTASLIVW